MESQTDPVRVDDSLRDGCRQRQWLGELDGEGPLRLWASRLRDAGDVPGSKRLRSHD